MFFAETPLCEDYRQFDLLSRSPQGSQALDSVHIKTKCVCVCVDYVCMCVCVRGKGREKRSATPWCRMKLLLRSTSGLHGNGYGLQAANRNKTLRGYFPPQKHQEHMLRYM